MDQQTPPHMPHDHIFHTFILSYNHQELPKLPELQTPPHLPHGHIFHTFTLSYNHQELPKLPELQTLPHLPHGHIFQSTQMRSIIHNCSINECEGVEEK